MSSPKSLEKVRKIAFYQGERSMSKLREEFYKAFVEKFGGGNGGVIPHAFTIAEWAFVQGMKEAMAIAEDYGFNDCEIDRCELKQKTLSAIKDFEDE